MKNLAILTLVVLAACGSVPTPKTPQQTVFAAQETYRAALKIEVTYAQLPRCKVTSLTICSEPSIVKQVKQIDAATWGSIKSAQQTVRTPGFGENTLQSAAIAAVNAANAFASVTSQLRTH